MEGLCPLPEKLEPYIVYSDPCTIDKVMDLPRARAKTQVQLCLVIAGLYSCWLLNWGLLCTELLYKTESSTMTPS